MDVGRAGKIYSEPHAKDRICLTLSAGCADIGSLFLCYSHFSFQRLKSQTHSHTYTHSYTHRQYQSAPPKKLGEGKHNLLVYLMVAFVKRWFSWIFWVLIFCLEKKVCDLLYLFYCSKEWRNLLWLIISLSEFIIIEHQCYRSPYLEVFCCI